VSSFIWRRVQHSYTDLFYVYLACFPSCLHPLVAATFSESLFHLRPFFSSVSLALAASVSIALCPSSCCLLHWPSSPRHRPFLCRVSLCKYVLFILLTVFSLNFLTSQSALCPSLSALPLPHAPLPSTSLPSHFQFPFPNPSTTDNNKKIVEHRFS
jgi:hypothetical protein